MTFIGNGAALSILTFSLLAAPGCLAQAAQDQPIEKFEQKLNDLTEQLSQTQRSLDKSAAEVKELRAELDALRAKAGAAPAPHQEEPSGELEALREQQDAMQSEIKQHDQTKVETVSKYPLRVSGVVLFNAFSNAGVVDNSQLPTIALPRFPGGSHGSSGATLRQTLITLDASGPRIGGARSSAELSVDFFGGVSANEYGYNAAAGVVRMRQGFVNLDWYRTSAQAGYTMPLISPLSPTSYATVAQPGLSGSGNLWAWSPQIKVEQRFDISERNTIALEGGLIDPQSPGYTSIQLDSPVEASRHPGYEGRLSYRGHTGHIGIGGYSASQFYASTTQIHSWAATGDWQIPITKWFELSGEAYRGRSLGGFGGGTYKDILTGMDSGSGLTRSTGVETAGGWGQLKFRPNPAFEANGAFGLDDAFGSNFEGLIFPADANPLELTTRNQTFVANLIYRPKSYLILSPEYRHIQTWQYTGPGSVAHIFTVTAGFQF
jgi:hypothetical protein